MKKIHGMSKSRFYGIWNDMMMRCYNPNKERYSSYGGRGIGVCKRWRVFNNFKKDMLCGYAPGLSIERIKINIGYSKSNCKWIPKSDQKYNKQNTIRLIIDGVVKTVPEWSAISGSKIFTIYARLSKGWPDKKAVFGGRNRVIFSNMDILEINKNHRNGISTREIAKTYKVSHTKIGQLLKN